MLAALAAGSVAVSACAPRLQTRVEAFASQAMAPRVGETVHVIPAATAARATLEDQAWVRLAESEFAARGFRIVSSPANAALVAVVGLAIDAGRKVARPFMIPQWGVTGYSGAQTFGTFSRFGDVGTYSGTTTLTPQYGVTGYATGVATQRVFTRRGILLVFRPPPPTTPCRCSRRAPYRKDRAACSPRWRRASSQRHSRSSPLVAADSSRRT